MNAIYQGDTYPLKGVAQDTPDDTVKVLTSDVGDYYKQVWLTPTQPLDFDEANSGAISEPTSNDRIALVSVSSAGALSWTYGTQASSPTPPDCPSGDLPLAYVYQRKNKTTIYNFEDDNGEDCYIYRDVRPALSLGGVQGAASSVAGNVPVFADTSGKILADSGEDIDNFLKLSGDVQLALPGATGGILTTGTHGSGWTEPSLGSGTRLLWYPRKSAFRAGTIGLGSFDWNDVYIGAYSFATGYNVRASGSSSHAEGNSCVAAGNSAHAEGRGTEANEDYSHAEGYYSDANAKHSHASGYKANTYLDGQYAHGGGVFTYTGDAQYSRLVAKAETTDATATELLLRGLYRMIMPDGKTWVFHIIVGARDGGNGDSAGYEFKGVIKRIGSATSLVGSVTKTVLAENISAWDCNVTADDTNEALSIKGTGASGKNIMWVATIHLTDIGY
jgi:hypothetical protein